MNATQRLIEAVEEVFRLSQLDYDGIDIIVQRAAANQEVKEALAAAKEDAEQSVGTLSRNQENGDIEFIPNQEIYVTDGMPVYLAPAKGSDDQVEKLQAFKDYVHQRLDEAGIPTHPPGEHMDAGCRVGQRLDIALAKGSGLTMDEVMEALDNVGRHEGWGLVTVAKGGLRKALEAHAENSSDNLRKG